MAGENIPPTKYSDAERNTGLTELLHDRDVVSSAPARSRQAAFLGWGEQMAAIRHHALFAGKTQTGREAALDDRAIGIGHRQCW